MGLATARTVPSPREHVPWWRRLLLRAFPPPVVPVGPPLHRLAADLHRLESEAERLLGDPSVLARGQRLLAVRMAYDLVMLDAARALEVPVPHDRAPFTSHERFMVSVGLTAAGLRW
ncbi:hypothetical protein [Aquipuribacter hungaricus]|uniref:Uncharacterized protein n=1 Tax=Aquipuribacter hungaricus TaxID=545624 RepID=A0ABV7WKQ8_9MICO